MRDAADPVVHALEDLEDGAGARQDIAEIFFHSAARRCFGSPRERAAFLRRWTGYYLREEPEHTLVALAADGRVAGYLTGCTDSAGARTLYDAIAYYGLFEDLFAAFPAHFHVNCHPRWRGRGVGSRLVRRFLDRCAACRLAGVHVVTAPDAGNAGFYRRLGFECAVVRPWRARQLLFLGRQLR